MRCFVSMLTQLFVFGSAMFFIVSADDMVLTLHNGQDVTLHEDNYWSFEDRTQDDLTESLNITLGDNRVIRINQDYTWKFLSKEDLASNKNVSVKTITAKGSCTHVVLSEATALAMKSAITKATKKLKASIKNKKLNYAKLRNCVRRVEKEIDTEENFVKGRGWNVVISIVLDKGSILAVLDCEKEKTPAKTAKK